MPDIMKFITDEDAIEKDPAGNLIGLNDWSKDIARKLAGEMKLELTAVQLSGCVETMKLDLGSLIAESGAKIENGPLPVVRGDATLLASVVQNLVSNAIKFRDGHAPVITITAEQLDGFAEIAVADNGIGIDDVHLESIFGAFKRLHGRAEYQGTGIGLAVVKKIVERHGGGIWAESRPGEGSTFTFTLPMAAGDERNMTPLNTNLNPEEKDVAHGA